MNKVYSRINWENEPSTKTPLNEHNLNKIDFAVDEIDNRVIELDATKAKNTDLQTLSARVDNLILNAGDSSAEAADARVTKDGTTYDTLKKRLDAEHSSVTEDISQLSEENAYQAKTISQILGRSVSEITVERGGINFSDYQENDINYFIRTGFIWSSKGTFIEMSEGWEVGVFYYNDELVPYKTSLLSNGSSALVSRHLISEDGYVRLVFINRVIGKEDLDFESWKENITITYPESVDNWVEIPFSVRNLSIGSADNVIYKQSTNTLRSLVWQISKGKKYKIYVPLMTRCKIGLMSEVNYGQVVKEIIVDKNSELEITQIENIYGGLVDNRTYGEYIVEFENDTDYNYAVAFVFHDTKVVSYDFSGVKLYETDTNKDKDNEIYFRPKKLLNGIRSDITNGCNVDGDISWTSDQIIENIYEPLRSAYPNYVTRENIGKDASSTYDMWCYIFAPKYYDKTVYIQGGVHAAETEGYWSVARFCQILCNNHSDYAEIEKLYQTTRFIVVPIVNVWRVSNKPTYIEGNYNGNSNSWMSSTNSNGVNLNRDGIDETQAETQNIHANFDKYADDVCLSIDSHTTTTKSWGDYLFVCEGTRKETTPALRTNNYLLNKNVKDRDTNNVFMGYSKDYPNGGVTGSFIQYFNEKSGIKAFTTEYSDYVFDYTIGTDIAITRATENLINQIVQNTNNVY